MKTFHLRIAQLDKELFDGEVVSLTVPAETGDMTLLAKHIPILAKLKKGRITIKDKDAKESTIDTSDAILEFSNNNANILLF